MSYAVAIGIDKGNDNLLRLTLQFAAPSTNSTGGGGGSEQYTNTVVTTVECDTIISGINIINSYISKQVTLSHAKIIVISESLAVEGVFKYIATLINNIEVRPDCNIIICRSSAEDFLNNSKPSLETLSARYYEQILNSTEYTGFTTSTTLSDFFSAYQSNSYNPVAILGGINSDSTHNINYKDAYVDMDGSYKANETPIKNKTSLEVMGLAVFHGDKLVGELTGMDSICHLICTGDFESTEISIPSPFNQNSIINLSVYENGSSNISVFLVNGSPLIKIKVPLTASVSSMEHGLDLSENENIKILESYASSYMKEKILNYLYKTSKNYHSDIVDFGKHLLPNYLTMNETENIDWLHLYSDSTFSVEVDIHIKGSYILIKN